MTIEEILNKYHVGDYVEYIMDRVGVIHKIVEINKDTLLATLLRVYEFDIETENLIKNPTIIHGLSIRGFEGNRIIGRKELLEKGIIEKSVDFITN